MFEIQVIKETEITGVQMLHKPTVVYYLHVQTTASGIS